MKFSVRVSKKILIEGIYSDSKAQTRIEPDSR